MLKYILYTDHYSPHELPLFLACAEAFDDVVYVVNRAWPQEASRKGWAPDFKGRRTIVLQDVDPTVRSAVFADLLTSDSVLMYGSYDNPYNELIVKSKGVVIYASERWLKPLCVRVPVLNMTLKIPGMAHLLSLRFVRRMISVFARLENDKRFFYLPLGIHAAADMARICGLLSGDLRCLFRVPEFELEKCPGGRMAVRGSQLAVSGGLGAVSGQRYCLDRMRMWGYFVEPSKFTDENSQTEIADDNSKLQPQNSKLKTLRVLWVGRLLRWKRVDTIIRAIGELAHSSNPRLTANDYRLTATLDIYGMGPEEARLKKMAEKYRDAIRFHPFVAMEEVRGLMRSHDVYILSSNEYEGWGAVVSEALEEGMSVLCSREAGAGATILPDECLFDCGDADGLRKKLLQPLPRKGIGPWSARNAALQLREFAKDVLREEDQCR